MKDRGDEPYGGDVRSGLTIAEAERITWRSLDRPTIAYVVELVRGVDEVAWLKLRAQLEALERHGGYIDPDRPLQ